MRTVADPRSADEVCALVDHARAHDRRIAVQTTGRGVRQTAPLDGTLLIRSTGLGGVTLDAPAEVVRAGGGALWTDVSRVAAPAGLAAPAVTTASIGVAGSVLAGGVGWLSRRHGLAAEHVRAIEIVTADGRLVRADPDRERDLFWALRGGGGGLGVVTAVELALIAPRELHAGTLVWPGARAADVLHAWRDWTEQAPREASSIVRLAAGEVRIETVLLGVREVAVPLVAPLRALAPSTDTFGPAAPSALDSLHEDILAGRPVHYDHLLLDELPAEAVDALLEVAEPGAGLPLLDVELRQLGGALNERSRDAGALGALDAGYLMVVASDPETASVAEELVDALSPWAAGHIFPGFAGSAEDVFVPDVRRRLTAVKALYDPEDRFVSPLVTAVTP
jgi:FAD/FMN-containing dehydrogenase